jgi:catechol 2,3-dioxygenase-like lactoylglutathione lyase family enzyme
MGLDSLPVGPVIPVSDLGASRRFYETTLGLRGESAPGGWVLFAGRDTRLFLLKATNYAGQAEWPLASFRTEDLDQTVADLAERGVKLLVMGAGDPFQTNDRGIAALEGMRIAWFRDPDNQVISVFELTDGSVSRRD